MFSRNEVAAIHDALQEVARLREAVKVMAAQIADLQQAVEGKKRKSAKS